MAAPFAVGVLSIDPPGAFGFLMVYYFLAETWFAILFTVLVEIVPNEVRSVCIGGKSFGVSGHLHLNIFKRSPSVSERFYISICPFVRPFV